MSGRSSRTAETVRAASALLMAIYLGAVLLSGLGLSLVWSPDRAIATTTVAGLEGDGGLPQVLRAVHAFSSDALLMAALLHVAAILAGAAASPSRPWPWSWGVACLLLAIAAAFSGRILPFDEHGGVSLGVAEAFFGLRGTALSALGRPGAGLGGVALLHALAGIAVVPALAVHARPRAAAGQGSEQVGLGRAGVAIVAAGVAGLLVAVISLRPALGPAFLGLDVTSAVSAAWYLRWLQAVAEQGLTLARLTVLALVAFGLSTPHLAARLGWPVVRAAWIAGALAAAGITASTYV